METIKEEKKADLEQLLNSLIEKGYIPFNIPEITEIKHISTKNKLRITSHQNNRDYKDDFSLRDLVSKGSGLWQFVCENGMLETKGNVRVKNYWGDDECDDNCCDDDLEYWLMESSLKDESELEDFLLSNIKVEG